MKNKEFEKVVDSYMKSVIKESVYIPSDEAGIDKIEEGFDNLMVSEFIENISKEEREELFESLRHSKSTHLLALASYAEYVAIHNDEETELY